MQTYKPNTIRAVRVYFPHGWIPQINIDRRDGHAAWYDMACPIAPFATPAQAILWACEDIMMDIPPDV